MMAHEKDPNHRRAPRSSKRNKYYYILLRLVEGEQGGGGIAFQKICYGPYAEKVVMIKVRTN